MALPGVKDFNSVPGLQPAADVGSLAGKVQAPRTNAALQLADALGDISPQLRQTGLQIAQQKADESAVKAKTDALSTMGLDYGEAVRRKLIEPTQNPWYIQAYNREGSYVKATSAFAQLQTDSVNWPEQNDPQAFQARYSQELGKIREQFPHDADSSEGFLRAAAPAQEQAFNANTGQNIARIKAERTSNMGSLIAQAIGEAEAQHGGSASPDQITEHLANIKEAWMNTGGTSEEWAKLTVAGTTSAAYNQKNPAIMDYLKATGLYNRPGVADAAETDRYRIQQSLGEASKLALEAANAKIATEGLDIQQKAYADPLFGTRLLTGQFDTQDFINYYTQKGYTPLGIRSALNQVQAGVADTQSLSAARLRAFGLDAGNSAELLGLASRASSEGWSEGLEKDITAQATSGHLPWQEAESLLTKSHATSTSLRAQNTAAQGEHFRGMRLVDEAAKNYASNALQEYISTIDGRRAPRPEETREANTVTDQAYRQWLASHPDDFQGATDASQMAAAKWLRQKMARRNAAPAGPLEGTR